MVRLPVLNESSGREPLVFPATALRHVLLPAWSFVG